MKKKYIYFIIFCFLLLVNTSGINDYILFKIDNDTFEYANADGSYTHRESFGLKDPRFTGFSFNYFVKETTPPDEARVLYRIYKINPICFWRWNHYLSTALKYKYMDWNKIEERRGIKKEKIVRSRYQTF